MTGIGYKILRGKGFPRKAYEGDACFDLEWRPETVTWPESCTLHLAPGKPPVKLATGIALAIPRGWEGIVRPRSGLSAKGIYVATGTINSGDRGELYVIMCALSWTDVVIRPGDRIAQLAIRRAPKMDQTRFIEVYDFDITERGGRGFGTSGA